MEDLQLVLFVLGAIAIIAVLVHGFWSIRKQDVKFRRTESSSSVFNKINTSSQSDDSPFNPSNNLSVGRRRARRDLRAEKQEPKLSSDEKMTDPIEKPHLTIKPNTQKKAELSASSTSPDDEYQTQEKFAARRDEFQMASELPEDNDAINGDKNASLKADMIEQVEDIQPATEVTTPDNVIENAVIEEPAVVEPVLERSETEKSKVDEPKAEETELAADNDPKDVLVLHVVAKEGHVIQGTDLLPCLLTLNFKYGEMNIFHRHEDNAGTGKVLFSLANMVEPGIFDPDHMEQFTTHGVVLFIALPCYGDALRNFSIMLNSAHQLADDLDAELLDGRRHPWCEVTKLDYLNRIKAAAR